MIDKTFHIPVILERKKFKGTKFWFNPKIDDNGNISESPETICWTHEKDVELIKWIIDNKKERIIWSKYGECSEAYRSRFRDLNKKYKLISKSKLEQSYILLKIYDAKTQTDV